MDPLLRKTARNWFIIGFISSTLFFSILLFFYKSSFEVAPEIENKTAFITGAIEGVEGISPETLKLEIKFGSGEVRIDYNEQSEINWDCDGTGKNAKVEQDDNEKSLRLDLSSAIVDCDITIPRLPLFLDGMHGEVEVRKIQADLNIQLLNGEVFLQPIEKQEYRYDLKVESGTVGETFQSSLSEDAINVHVEMKYGSVELLD